MKRVLFAVLALSLFTGNAGAQAMKMKFGGNFNVNVDKDVIDYKVGDFQSDEVRNTFQVVLKPKLYWYINEKMQFGAFFGIGYGNIISDLSNGGLGQTTVINPDGSWTITTVPVKSSGNSLGWSFTPYYGYKLFNLGRIDIWVEASAYFGMYYKVSGDDEAKSKEDPSVIYTWNNDMFYGVQVMPVVDVALTDQLALQIHAGVFGLGWKVERISCDSYTETTSSIDFHKGGIMGLFQSIGDFGIGVVKRF